MSFRSVRPGALMHPSGLVIMVRGTAAAEPRRIGMGNRSAERSGDYPAYEGLRGTRVVSPEHGHGGCTTRGRQDGHVLFMDLEHEISKGDGVAEISLRGGLRDPRR